MSDDRGLAFAEKASARQAEVRIDFFKEANQ